MCTLILKDLSDFPKSYEPKIVEKDWDKIWNERGQWKPKIVKDKSKNQVILIPPPNVTGTLHLGHALQLTIEDTMVRQKRMKGFNCLWIPGLDHAGIATQAVVEKTLMKQGISKQDLGREKFLEKVFEWKEKQGGSICQQFRCVGISVDWDRLFFTMDEIRARAVNDSFVDLYDKGIIFRANRLVNWSTKLRTAISDLEVDHMDLTKKTSMAVPGQDRNVAFGVIHKFAYPLEDGSGKLVVATTRLETMFGDTAVAVHPEDPRQKQQHGKFIKHPFNGRRLPIILDAELVDMEFGTGAVKITPAHDQNDFTCGKKHNLEFINVFTLEGLINENGGEFKGLKRFDARQKLIEKMTQMGIQEGEEENPMRLGICSRSGDVIEPILIPQWWIDNTNMAKRAVDAVKNKELKIIPDYHERTWFQQLENIRDWCISRQLWWGHRIPAYMVQIPGKVDTPDSANQAHWVVGKSKADALARAAVKFNTDPKKITLIQDEDVLDTWQSSGILPFSSLRWPDTQHPDFQNFQPTQLLETGHDILFFWVARMVMMSLEVTDQLPFREIQLHAIVRDAQGRKMSKSLGNVIDPMWLIDGITLQQMQDTLKLGNLAEKEIEKAGKGMEKEQPTGIPECGADALRQGLLAYMFQGSFINLDVKRVFGWRLFCNKIWNATKFALSYFDEGFKPLDIQGMVLSLKANKVQLQDHWILSKLSATVKFISNGQDNYKFAENCQNFYELFMQNFCDIQLEMTKPMLASADPSQKHLTLSTLWHMLEVQFRLVHPMMPFISEELYQRLPSRPSEAICIAEFPAYDLLEAFESPQIESQVEALMNVIKSIRSVKSSLDYKNSRPDAAIQFLNAETAQKFPTDYLVFIKTLAKCENVQITEKEESKMLKSVVDTSTHVFVSLTDGVNLVEEKAKISKQLANVQKVVDSLTAKIEKKGQTDKVPIDIQTQDRIKLEEKREELKQMQDSLSLIHSIAGNDSTDTKPKALDKNDLNSLEKKLSKNAFMTGNKPTQEDKDMLNKIKGIEIQLEKLPNILRWINLMANFK